MKNYIIILTTVLYTLSSCIKEPAMNGITERNYERRDTLQDGVSIFYKINSHIYYDTPYAGTVRISGEAFFKTNGKLVHPFRVASNNWVVESDSADFNVNNSDLFKTSIVVRSGVVTATIYGKVERLDSGSCTTFTSAGIVPSKEGYCKNALLWMYGIYSYEEVDLYELECILSWFYPDYNIIFRVNQMKLVNVYIDTKKSLVPQLQDIAYKNILRYDVLDKAILIRN